MDKFIIKDWAGNIIFDGKEFDNPDDAWGYLMELNPEDDGSLDEYFVVSV